MFLRFDCVFKPTDLIETVQTIFSQQEKAYIKSHIGAFVMYASRLLVLCYYMLTKLTNRNIYYNLHN